MKSLKDKGEKRTGTRKYRLEVNMGIRGQGKDMRVLTCGFPGRARDDSNLSAFGSEETNALSP